MPSQEKSPSEAAEEQELKDNVSAAIAVLPEKERTVTTLFYINGYSQKEIGEFLGIAVKTVKNHLYAARSRLRERMLTMVQDTLRENRPSRDEQFVKKVLLQEGFDDARHVNETWQNVPDLGIQEGKLDLTYRFLFSIDRQLESDWDIGTVSQALRRTFANHKISLSDAATISTLIQQRWVIADPRHEQAFVVKYPGYEIEGRNTEKELWVYNCPNSVYLGSSDNDLQFSAEWEDPFKTFRKGAIGFWQDTGSGESAQYDNLVVTTIE